MSLIQVDRNARYPAPQGTKHSIFRTLAGTGPESYELESLELWTPPGDLTGFETLRQIQSIGLLELCLALQDGMTIRQNNAEPARDFFGQHATLVLWKSVVEDFGGVKRVPRLYLGPTTPSIDWMWLGDRCTCLTPHFPRTSR